jgi:hypothetical protein
MFSVKVVGNFRYLSVVTTWRQREVDRLDKYWTETRTQNSMVVQWNHSRPPMDYTQKHDRYGIHYDVVVLSHTLHVCTCKEEMTRDPKPLRGISFATVTRHLRILRKRLEKLMGKSGRLGDPPWPDLPKQQWELLCQVEVMWKKYGALLWEPGHKTVVLFPGSSTIPLHIGFDH